MKRGHRVAFGYLLWGVLIVGTAGVLYWVAGQRDGAPPLAPSAGPTEDGAALRGQVAVLARRLDALERQAAGQSARLDALVRQLESLQAELVARRAHPVVVYVHREMAALRDPLRERLTRAGFRVRLLPDLADWRPYDLDGYPTLGGYGALSPLGGEGSSILFPEAAAPQARQLAELARTLGLPSMQLRPAAAGRQEIIHFALVPAPPRRP